ncbi:type II toxin-antitoxin system Phd/YefM family antitoxin [Rhodococcus sp. NCIMB 12038]|uniref:type II toxin-antitoxin system Phd/YefM family antitoxin n=1 Tax=Rhodococcus sp. NCIMB 12038 TaxID=933800 RepID=UPI000B3BED94|nr:type II toxin-antitoxin system Phd/YefM family antitoxin [Rhodococcus sp. NCIMB 12038]OUS97361.1 hypothetical protein CA951_03175 [Rhodococcus sp. NCIMB 12038]
MPDTNNIDRPDESVDKPFDLIPLDRAPGLVLPMIARFAKGLPEPMIIGAHDRPVAALVTIEDLQRLREYDQRALDSEDSFYSELNDRVQSADTTEVVTDLNAFARTLGPLGEQWANRRSQGDRG